MAAATELRLGIGLIGAGAIMNLSHAPTISRSADAKLNAVFDDNKQRVDTLANEYGARAYSELDAFSARPTWMLSSWQRRTATILKR